MASIITQNIGTAAASAGAQPQIAPPTRDQSARPITSTEVNRTASQEATRNLAGNVKGGDQKRSVQVPKRVEASYSARDGEGVKKEQVVENEVAEKPQRPARAVA
jgi:hypothetical protein